MECAPPILRHDLDSRRADRVCWFIILLGLLNLFDLQMTLKAMQYGVMFEANPVAASVISDFGIAGVSLFKTLSIGSALIMFLIGRNLKISEVGCFTAVLLYLGVCILWAIYPWDTLVAFHDTPQWTDARFTRTYPVK